ncbi:MAG TPA: zinc-binding alcohol dehydrogenase [Chloroflexota bacterium]|nr:zinc-binding alcohol dehydrogenase [Chloroflexota bacterium]
MTNHRLWFTAPGQVEVRVEPLPGLAADEVLVQTAVSAISAGTEMLLYRGQWPPDLPVDETIEALQGTFAYPLSYGYACVGQVADVGREVAAGWHGRWVFAFQPHQSHFMARPETLLPLPEGMSPETAVFLPNMETAVSFVMDGRPVIGEQVAVLGQGVVGLLTTRLLADFPMAALVTADGYALRREWSRQVGATAVFDPTAPDVLADMRAALQQGSPYPGADLVYELSGNPAALDMAIGLAGFDGRVLIGSWYGQKRANVDLGGAFHRGHMRLISSQVSRLHPRWHGRFDKTRRLQTTWRMLAHHNPAPLITHRFPLADADKAYQLLDKEGGTAVQVVFVYL